METILEVKDINIGYQTGNGIKDVIEGVSFSLRKNEVLALVGGSGCGKTTLCRAVTGLTEGMEITGEISYKSNKSIAMVFQDPYLSLDPSQPIGKQIEETVMIHIEKHAPYTGNKRTFAEKKSLELLDVVGIENPEMRYHDIPAYFSGGMRQRVAIAISLAMEPDILIGDELTSSLDNNNKDEIMTLLDDLRSRIDTAVIIVTHDLGLVEDHCDRVIILKDGIIEEIGETDRIFVDPQSEYTKDLVRYAGYRKGTEHTHGDLHFHGGVVHSHDHKKVHIHNAIHPSVSYDSRLGHVPHLIEIRGLGKSYKDEKYGEKPVFKDLNINIHKGEMLGLSGRSGAGKTTLAKCIVGLEKHDRGDIRFSPELREKNSVQMIFQDSKSSLDPRMTVKKSIFEAIKLSKTLFNTKAGRRFELEELLEMAELDSSLLPKRPYEISGGQRQRVAIARALAMDPELLIADEPISSLDMAAQAKMIHLLKRIQEENDLTVLFISHDIPMLVHVCDRIISMDSDTPMDWVTPTDSITMNKPDGN